MQIQLITFEIDAKMLAVDIMAVREIRAWTPTTPIPNAPPFVRGVVNLRGLVLPVIDLSERLGWGRVEPNERNVIIVVEIAGQMTGLIVGSAGCAVCLALRRRGRSVPLCIRTACRAAVQRCGRQWPGRPVVLLGQ
ncbi:chemotaxis protein CheW [Porphyrobacter sp. CCH7-A1]|uniref:chemotaxis protein CheW n=1 Tax=Porphyrobacter sp. CCH7-A1 TaxID=1768773 RepID=UPI0009EA02A2|nr:chemotaxis protein CheW [Porphyrobacter sp. CCH7-A1]